MRNPELDDNWTAGFVCECFRKDSLLAASRSGYVVETICLLMAGCLWIPHYAASSSERTWLMGRNFALANHAG